VVLHISTEREIAERNSVYTSLRQRILVLFLKQLAGQRLLLTVGGGGHPPLKTNDAINPSRQPPFSSMSSLAQGQKEPEASKQVTNEKKCLVVHVIINCGLDSFVV
jgi:hypothetical protein